jgi:hypothetical protein
MSARTDLCGGRSAMIVPTATPSKVLTLCAGGGRLCDACGAGKPVAHYSGFECATRNGSFGLLRGSGQGPGWRKECSAGYVSSRLSILFGLSLQKCQCSVGETAFPYLFMHKVQPYLDYAAKG